MDRGWCTTRWGGQDSQASRGGGEGGGFVGGTARMGWSPEDGTFVEPSPPAARPPPGDATKNYGGPRDLLAMAGASRRASRRSRRMLADDGKKGERRSTRDTEMHLPFAGARCKDGFGFDRDLVPNRSTTDPTVASSAFSDVSSVTDRNGRWGDARNYLREETPIDVNNAVFYSKAVPQVGSIKEVGEKEEGLAHLPGRRDWNEKEDEESLSADCPATSAARSTLPSRPRLNRVFKKFVKVRSVASMFSKAWLPAAASEQEKGKRGRNGNVVERRVVVKYNGKQRRNGRLPSQESRRDNKTFPNGMVKAGQSRDLSAATVHDFESQQNVSIEAKEPASSGRHADLSCAQSDPGSSPFSITTRTGSGLKVRKKKELDDFTEVGGLSAAKIQVKTLQGSISRAVSLRDFGAAQAHNQQLNVLLGNMMTMADANPMRRSAPDRIPVALLKQRKGIEQREFERAEESRATNDHTVRKSRADYSTMHQPLTRNATLSSARETMRGLVDNHSSDRPAYLPLSYLEHCADGFSDKRLLGEGSYSKVFLAEDKILRRKFAVKKIRIKCLSANADIKEVRKTFERELMTLKNFRHKNISKLYGYYLSPDLRGNHCLVFEFAEKGSLYDLLKCRRQQQEQFHWSTRISVALDISRALKVLHDGIGGQICFHRDIKSENVCLKRDHTALLIDFGASKMIPEDEAESTMTIMESAGNKMRGTPCYTCPVYARDLGGYTSAQDVFSLGIVLTELFTGILQNSVVGGEKVDLFNQYSEDGSGAMQLEDNADEKAGAWKDRIRKEFARLVIECISYSPRKRPPINDVVDRLENFASMARRWSPGERNCITVLSSDPLVWSDGNDIYPINNPLDLDQERLLLDQCFTVTGRDIKLKFDIATSDRLQAAAAKRCGCLHFSGHGFTDSLLFEDESGGAHFLSEEQLRSIVDHKPFCLLAFVSACNSSFMGEALVKEGVPHVICCKHDSQIRDEAAIKFTFAFYSSLVEGYSVKDAFEEGKHAVLSRFCHVECDKFVLLPTDGDHEKRVFQNVEKREWQGRCNEERFIPSPWQSSNENRITKYCLLQCILTNRLVTLVGDPGGECSNLASAVCCYIDARKKLVFLDVEAVYFVRDVRAEHIGQGVFGSFIKPLHERLVAEGKAGVLDIKDCLSTCNRSVAAALGSNRALIVFDGVDSTDESLGKFLATIFDNTNNVKILLVATEQCGFSSCNVRECIFVED